MKNIILLTILSMVLLMPACIKDELVLPERIEDQDESQGTERNPVKPDYIEVLTDFDTKVQFIWPSIDTERIKAIHLSYINHEEEQQIEITDFSKTLVLEGLEIGKSYEFVFTAIGLNDDVSKAYSVTASPKPMAVDMVAESISVNPFIFGDAEVRWYNSTGHKVLIHVSINEEQFKSDASDTTSGLFTIEGLERNEYMLEVSVSDSLGNISSAKSYPVKVVAEILANTTGWVATANSEHHPGENTGLASALIDGDLNTIWHTRWDAGAPAYPHWAQFDMLETALVSKIQMAARQNNTQGMTKFRLQGSLNGTSWTTILDNQTFDPENKAFQEYAFAAQEFRYLKLIPLEGKANYTHLAELRVYTYQ